MSYPNILDMTPPLSAPVANDVKAIPVVYQLPGETDKWDSVSLDYLASRAAPTQATVLCDTATNAPPNARVITNPINDLTHSFSFGIGHGANVFGPGDVGAVNIASGGSEMPALQLYSGNSSVDLRQFSASQNAQLHTEAVISGRGTFDQMTPPLAGDRISAVEVHGIVRPVTVGNFFTNDLTGSVVATLAAESWGPTAAGTHLDIATTPLGQTAPVTGIQIGPGTKVTVPSLPVQGAGPQNWLVTHIAGVLGTQSLDLQAAKAVASGGLGHVSTDAYAVAITGGVPLQVNLSGQIGIATSSIRFKKNVVPVDPISRLQRLNDLRTVTYQYKEGDDKQQVGFIAEEVQDVYPEYVVRDSEGQIHTVNYSGFIPELVAGLQALTEEVRALKKQRTE